MSGRRHPAACPYGLNDRQRLFVDEYLVDLNIAAAARRSGYSPATAHAPDKILNPAVQQAIDDAIAARAQRTRLDADRVITELAKLAFANMGDFFTVAADGLPRLDFSRLTREDSAALQAMTVDYFRPGPKDAPGADPAPRRIRIQLADKRAALMDLARHLGVAAPADARPAADEEETYNGTAVYKFIHVVTGVPRHDEPTGQRGYMWQIAGPRPCPQRPDAPHSPRYLKALADYRAEHPDWKPPGEQDGQGEDD